MKKILEVPKIKQLTNYDCGLACLTMIMQYHGIDVDLKTLFKEFKFRKPWGKPIGLKQRTIVNLANKYKLKARNKYTNYSIKDIISEIDKENPPIIWVPVHYLVAKGYDCSKKIIYINDPMDLRRNRLFFNELLKYKTTKNSRSLFTFLDGMTLIRK